MGYVYRGNQPFIPKHPAIDGVPLCKAGHEMTPENISGSRSCKRCDAARASRPCVCSSCGRTMAWSSFHKHRREHCVNATRVAVDA